MNSSIIIVFVVGAVALNALILAAGSVRVVPEDERLIHYRLGREIGIKGPGVVFVIPFVDQTRKIKSKELEIENRA